MEHYNTEKDNIERDTVDLTLTSQSVRQGEDLKCFPYMQKVQTCSGTDFHEVWIRSLPSLDIDVMSLMLTTDMTLEKHLYIELLCCV